MQVGSVNNSERVLKQESCSECNPIIRYEQIPQLKAGPLSALKVKKQLQPCPEQG